MSGDPPKVQSKLSDAQLTGASLLSDGEQMEEVARDAEDRESQISSRKSSIKEEVTLTKVMLIKRFLANDFILMKFYFIPKKRKNMKIFDIYKKE